MNLSMHVTVAICTWNRARLLDQTLAEMRKLRIPPGVTWELLVVNNNCTDDTDAVIERHTAALPIRRLVETTQGQPSARNCAITAATGELLIWTDDDVLVDPEWLDEYVRGAIAWPDASFFGGPVEPWFEVEPPGWVQRHLLELSGPLVIQKAYPDESLVKRGESPVGANMAFRTRVLKSSPFDPRFGRTGSHILGNDDIWKVAELQSQGIVGRWLPKAKIKHFIPKSRMTGDYLFRFISGHHETEVLAAGPERLDSKIPLWAVRLWIEGTMMRVVGSFCNSNLWYRGIRKAAIAHGVFAGRRQLLSTGQHKTRNGSGSASAGCATDSAQ